MVRLKGLCDPPAQKRNPGPFSKPPIFAYPIVMKMILSFAGIVCQRS